MVSMPAWPVSIPTECSESVSNFSDRSLKICLLPFTVWFNSDSLASMEDPHAKKAGRSLSDTVCSSLKIASTMVLEIDLISY